jgi:hypothetical protein
MSYNFINVHISFTIKVIKHESPTLYPVSFLVRREDWKDNNYIQCNRTYTCKTGSKELKFLPLYRLVNYCFLIT